MKVVPCYAACNPVHDNDSNGGYADKAPFPIAAGNVITRLRSFRRYNSGGQFIIWDLVTHGRWGVRHAVYNKKKQMIYLIIVLRWLAEPHLVLAREHGKQQSTQTLSVLWPSSAATSSPDRWRSVAIQAIPLRRPVGVQMGQNGCAPAMQGSGRTLGWTLLSSRLFGPS